MPPGVLRRGSVGSRAMRVRLLGWMQRGPPSEIRHALGGSNSPASGAGRVADTPSSELTCHGPRDEGTSSASNDRKDTSSETSGTRRTNERTRRSEPNERDNARNEPSTRRTRRTKRRCPASPRSTGRPCPECQYSRRTGRQYPNRQCPWRTGRQCSEGQYSRRTGRQCPRLAGRQYPRRTGRQCPRIFDNRTRHWYESKRIETGKRDKTAGCGTYGSVANSLHCLQGLKRNAVRNQTRMQRDERTCRRR
jgi:hypothetical protein